MNNTQQNNNETENRNKKKIIGIGGLGILLIVGGGYFLLKGKKGHSKDAGWVKITTHARKINDIEIPAFETAHIDDLWQEDGDVLGIMHDVCFQDLGKFGKELKDKIPELADMDFVHFPTIGFTKYNED